MERREFLGGTLSATFLAQKRSRNRNRPRRRNWPAT